MAQKQKYMETEITKKELWNNLFTLAVYFVVRLKNVSRHL